MMSSIAFYALACNTKPTTTPIRAPQNPNTHNPISPNIVAIGATQRAIKPPKMTTMSSMLAP